MNFLLKRVTLTLLLSGLLISTAAAQSAIVFVRHAEKAANITDPDLSDIGRERAKRLANLLKDARISAIFVTEFKRTQQTAAPLASRLHLIPKIVQADSSPALLARLGASTGNLLVVGHSNTIPDLIQAFGITTPVHIDDEDYGNLFILLRGPRPSLIRSRYR